jgi:hypothetical protein
VQYDVLVMAIWCSRLFTGERFSEGPATVLLDRGKIVGVETGHVQLDESWQVAEYPTATVLPGASSTPMFILSPTASWVRWIASRGSATMSWTRPPPMGCGVSWRPG